MDRPQKQTTPDDDIRSQKKKKKEYNRPLRQTTDPDERERLNENYLRQKKKVQQLVKEEMHKYEIKSTNEIKENKDSSKLWEAINKLKNVKQNSSAELILYNEERCKLPDSEASNTLVEHWNTIYRKHENNIQKVWTQETKAIYTKDLNDMSIGIMQ